METNNHFKVLKHLNPLANSNNHLGALKVVGQWTLLRHNNHALGHIEYVIKSCNEIDTLNTLTHNKHEIKRHNILRHIKNL